ncbi:Lin1244/Lin1753 domain-containing protein [Lactiplantibacillus plantarum]|uniref:Lin1244/Lin1753 domain-containing protein n=1 Tax=Lactiplantibacillus plantarum TaxID=1590 RepID=UPI0009B50282|nr:Lin1244/Lin1753 domain-containing protein [Lactiplantibacillus plantarum]
MARPVKEGLDYFPLDVDFAVNDKTEAIMGEFGPKGVLFMIYLLSAVYQNGYYLQWNKLKQMQLANRIEGVSPELANQIVNRLIAYGTFSEELFNSAKVLTSQRIQETYEDATKRRKSQKPTKYWINVDINADSTGVNDDINQQSKVKESKVNKSKANQNDPFSSENLNNLSNNTPARTRGDIFKDIEAEFGRGLSPIEMETVSSWFDKDNLDPDIVFLALREASLNQAYSIKYMDRTLLNWQKRNLRTATEIEKYNEAYRQDKLGRESEPIAKQSGQNAVPHIPLFKLGEQQN